jgi:hypothetical protein
MLMAERIRTEGPMIQNKIHILHLSDLRERPDRQAASDAVKPGMSARSSDEEPESVSESGGVEPSAASGGEEANHSTNRTDSV